MGTNTNFILIAERTTLEPVNHELAAQYGFGSGNITELGTDMTPTSMSQLRNVLLYSICQFNIFILILVLMGRVSIIECNQAGIIDIQAHICIHVKKINQLQKTRKKPDASHIANLTHVTSTATSSHATGTTTLWRGHHQI